MTRNRRTMRDMRRTSAARPAALTFVLCLLLGLLAEQATGVTHLKRGDPAPPIALESLSGRFVRLEESDGRPQVIIFGELYHDRTLKACGEIRDALAGPAANGAAATTLLVIAEDAPTEALSRRASDPRVPALILHDRARTTFGDYRVTVMPSVVVIDADGRVVYALAGYTTRLKDTVADAVQVAAGRMTQERFDRLLHPDPRREDDDPQVRAARITSLAGQLDRRGLPDLAEEKYREAMELASDYAPARLGLAMVLLHRNRLVGAETEFRAVLDADPASVEAALGLAYVETLRGGDELEDARATVTRLLERDPEEPRAHYLLGLIYQQLDQPADAIESYRKASELLMSQRKSWTVIPGRPRQ